MEKWKHIALGLLVFLLCAGILNACLNYRAPVIYGEITDFTLGEDGQLASFTIHRADNGNKQNFSLTEESLVISSLEDLSGDDFLREPQLNASITVHLEKGAEKDVVRDLRVWGLLERNAGTLSDGTSLDIMRESRRYTYRLTDGTELLTVKEGIGPENTSSAGAADLNDLDEAVRQRILEYYEAQGILYDETAELERAYAAWQKLGRKYPGRMLEQKVTPTASNDRVVYFTTDIAHPEDHGLFCGWQLMAAFDRRTGEQIENRTLFTCPEEEILERLLNIAQLDYDKELLSEMEAAFRVESVTLFPELIVLAFPKGTLPSKNSAYIITADLTGEALELLHNWAVPEKYAAQ